MKWDVDVDDGVASECWLCDKLVVRVNLIMCYAV